MPAIYTFTLPNKNRKYYLRFALLLLAVNYLLYFLDASNRVQNDDCTWWRCLLIPGLIVTALVVYGFQPGRSGAGPLYPNRQTVLLSLFGYGTAIWAFNAQWLPAAVLLLLGILFSLADRDFVFTFTEAAITISSSPPRNYLWPDLQNVILNNGLLTIDRKDNRLFQMDISAAEMEFGEAELNGFCKERLGQQSYNNTILADAL